MNLVVDAEVLSVHGLGRPRPISAVEERAVYFCLGSADREKEKAPSAVTVEFAAPSGGVRASARLEAVSAGPGNGEFEMVLRFRRPGRGAREALEALREGFEERYGFLEHRRAEALQSPEVLRALEGTGTPRTAEIDEEAFSRALAAALGLPYADLEITGVDVLQARDFAREFLLEHLFLPLFREGKVTKVAVGRMLAPRAVAALRRSYGEKFRYVVAPASQIISAIETSYHIRTNRRRAARIAVALRVRLGLYDEHWNLLAGPVDGTTRNISPGGVLVVAQPLVEEAEAVPGRRAGILVYLPEYEEPLRGAGRFLRARPVSGPASILHSYAIELNYLPREDRRRLDVFRYTLLWGPRRLKVEE